MRTDARSCGLVWQALGASECVADACVLAAGWDGRPGRSVGWRMSGHSWGKDGQGAAMDPSMANDGVALQLKWAVGRIWGSTCPRFRYPICARTHSLLLGITGQGVDPNRYRGSRATCSGDGFMTLLSKADATRTEPNGRCSRPASRSRGSSEAERRLDDGPGLIRQQIATTRSWRVPATVMLGCWQPIYGRPLLSQNIRGACEVWTRLFQSFSGGGY